MKLSVLLAALVLVTITAVQGSRKIFCYYSSFAQTRPGIGKFLPEDIDPFICTHVIFAFVDITRNGQDLLQFNWNDEGTSGLYARTLALKEKNPQLKILLAVGGWMIGSKPFVPMIRSESNRRTWIKNVIKYLRRCKFDGFDMDWEFPGTRGSPPEDKYRFTLLMKEIYESFSREAKVTGQPKLILTLATAAGTYYISQSYEPHEIIRYLDYMLLMTYNYHGHWETKTGHHGAMWKHPRDPPGEKSELHVEWSIDYWLNVGIPKSKLVIGIATYGMSFTLTNPNQHGLYAPAHGGGEMGEYTSERGILSYYEVCERIQKRGWKTKWIDEQGAPYAYKGDQWVGYEDEESIKIKANNIVKRGLAGAFVWSVEMDDFSGSCGQGESPLLNTIRDVLKPYGRDGEWVARSSIATSRAPVVTKGTQPALRSKPAQQTKSTWKPRPTWARREPGKPKSSPRPKGAITKKAERPKSTSRPVTKHPSAAGSVDCSKHGMGIFADPSSCNHFILCLYAGQQTYRRIKMDCPEGTRFDRDLKICNHANEIECWE